MKFDILAFKRDIIESLDDDEFYISINNDGIFKMTKSQFYQEFHNVAESDSYRVKGIYNYKTTPQRAYKFIVPDNQLTQIIFNKNNPTSATRMNPQINPHASSLCPTSLDTLIQKYIDDFNKKSNLYYVVKNSIPIIWFGDINKYNESKKRVLTIALNPSLKEFSEPRFDTIDLSTTNKNRILELTTTLNNYFRKNPYKSWFQNFENPLNAINASYYDSEYSYQAIHIDIYSAIATNPTWSVLKKQLSKSELEGFIRIDLFNQLLDYLSPNVILFSANNEVFTELFSDFCFEKRKMALNSIGFIEKYHKANTILINGRNMNGTPFGGMSKDFIYSAMRDLV